MGHTLHEKFCRVCSTAFQAANTRQIYCQQCRRSGHSARRLRTQLHTLQFIGVDGEGVDRPDATHQYVMLSVGSKTLWKNGQELTVSDILPFLWECYKAEPTAAYVGFFLGYDFIQWLKHLPERHAYFLFTNAGISERKSQRKSVASPFPDPVVFEGWELDIMAGRRFKLKPHIHKRSMFSDLCRNRTCREPLEFTDDFPLVNGETDFIIPDDPVTLLPFTGWSLPLPKESQTTNSWMYICDTGPFWQTSFLNVIDPKNWTDSPVCSVDEYKTVVEGKADRGSVHDYGDISYFEPMQQYNVLENEILARVTERLNQGFMNDQIPIRIARNEWYGPGRAAQLWMDQLHDKIADKAAILHNKATGARFQVANTTRRNEHGLLNADVYMSMPSWFYEAAQSSYYGGWFEQFMHGHIGDVYEYDINSAYPFIIASLPCLHTAGLHNGRYYRGTGSTFPTSMGSYTLVYGTFSGSDPYIGALPFRTKSGNILRPHRVRGWYWWHEVQAAVNANIIDTTNIEQWASFISCDCSPPFDPSDIGITRMYDLRLQIGKNTPAGKTFKLLYNAAYGKTAQSIGSPKYSNPVYASLITAGCRTLILKAIASHPLRTSGVSMVATDGVYFIERHPFLEMSPTRLGAWDETVKRSMTQLMPGVYWDDATRQRIRDGKSPQLKSRGIAARDLSKQIRYLDQLFAQFVVDVENGQPIAWPELRLPIGFQIVSSKLALARGKWETAGHVEHGKERKISANPISKREPVPYQDKDVGGILRTYPYREWSHLDTVPYHKTFGWRNPDESIYVDRDGQDPLDYFRDLING